MLEFIKDNNLIDNNEYKKLKIKLKMNMQNIID